MNTGKRAPDRRIISFVAGLLLPLLFAPWAHAAPLALSQTPLFTENAAKSNLILAIDDSGSMDSALLFDSNDGALWWNTSDQSFVDSGAVNFNTSGSADSAWKRYRYLFPNGTGTGEKAFSDSSNFYAVPPFPQFAFARSSEFNKMYYNPNVTYSPWPSNGTDIYGDITSTAAPSDPATGSSTFNLTTSLKSTTSQYEFTVFTGLVIPDGTVFHDGSDWITASSDITVPGSGVSSGEDIGVEYWPATYYVRKTSGSYSVNGASGNCASPSASHYLNLEGNPSSLTGTDVDALSFDGSCLTEVEIRTSITSYTQDGSRTDCASSSSCTYAEEIQNFSNWYSYFRRRHLALRAGVGQAFNGLSSIRTGLFTINNQSSVSMRDLSVSADSQSFYDQLYDIVGQSGGTPNRAALDYAGSQFMRTDAEAPITDACQKNFTLFFTDGYTGDADYVSSVGNADGDNDNYSGVVPYEDEHRDTFADIAMHYYKTNLRSDLDTGEVSVLNGCNLDDPDPRLDCNTNLHMNTYTVGLGAKGTLFNVSYHSVADAFVSGAAPSWPNTNTNRDATQIDDLYHAAVNGRGEIYNASSGDDLQNQLQDALVTIQSQLGSASAVTFNTATLASNSNVFLALFNSGTWSGDLLAYSLSATGEVSTTSSWSAADQLDDGTPSAANRVVLTYDGSAGTPFAVFADLTTAQQADLSDASAGGTGQQALDYIRGDRSREASGQFRVRASLLADIIRASPVFVGGPDLNWPAASPFPTATGEKYSDYRSGLITTPRTEVVYAGANDGMLHGFNASTGEEVLAYIPNILFSDAANEGLHYLTDPLYQHHNYVDMSPVISDIYIETDSTASPADPEWRTVLVGALGGGGKGLYALDITDPSAFSESNAADIVLWEFSAADLVGQIGEDDLGLTYSKPTIAMMENGRWAAIFGNGYNSTNEEAKLFIIFLDGGLDGTWSDGSGSTDEDYIVIETDGSTSNGMSTPRVVDTDGNGAADRVYAGDLQGNMWVFDLSGSSTNGWEVAYTTGSGGSATNTPLFTAKDSGGAVQPITTKPAVAFHQEQVTSGNEPNLMVFFGSGQFLQSADITDTSVQSFYGIWDHGVGGILRDDNAGVDGLQVQTLGTLTNGSDTFRGITNTTITYSDTNGWYIDLVGDLAGNDTLQRGERSVVDPSTRGSNIFFNTSIPSADGCSAGGSGFLMSVAQLNGGEPGSPVFDTNDDGVVDDNDEVGVHNPIGQEFVNGLPASSKFLGNRQYTPGTGSPVIDPEGGGGGGNRPVEELGGSSMGRLSWQELRN